MAGKAYIGVMSGTSVDGIDACLVRFPGGRPRLLSSVSHPFDPALRAALLEAANGTDLAGAATLDVRLADAYAEAVQALLDRAALEPEAVSAIGCHGQTVLHRPDGPFPTSVQLGDPNRLAVRAGIDVVADFRRADIACGGQGAPLAPAFHAAALSGRREARAVVNLGGMANVTLLAPGGRDVVGFDTGPGNALIDAWHARHRGSPIDAGGGWAASGRVLPALLERMLDDPYFRQPPPKSTGRERFHAGWLEACLAGLPEHPEPADVQATLAELTAVSVANAIERHAPDTRAVYASGGGARNRHLLARLQAHLGQCEVATTAALGIEPEHVEAVAFAWLAQRRVRGLPGNRPEVTGADRALVLGSLVRAPRSAPCRGQASRAAVP